MDNSNTLYTESTTVLFGRKFKVRIFTDEKKANEYMESHAWGVLKEVDGKIMLARLSDKGV